MVLSIDTVSLYAGPRYRCLDLADIEGCHVEPQGQDYFSALSCTRPTTILSVRYMRNAYQCTAEENTVR